MTENVPWEAHGVFGPDPIGDLKDGTSFSISASTFRGNRAADLFALPTPGEFDGAVLSLHFLWEDRHSAEASAVMVAPGVALTAAHVFNDRLKGLMAGEIVVHAAGLKSGGVQLWAINQITIVQSSDLAILTTELRSHDEAVEVKQAQITTRLPQAGEQMTIAGFRASQNEFEGGRSRANYAGAMLVASGEIVEVHPLGRDRCLLPWPVVMLDSAAFGGMSGGPAFDEAGKLVGLVSVSLSSEEGAAGGSPTYVSLIWPALGHQITPVWPKKLYSGPTSLLSMDRHLCHIDRPEALDVEPNEPTGAPNIRYTAWS